MSKKVYFFGANMSDGDGTMKDLLGGKGANLAEMAKAGLPVPPGFTITTENCRYFSKNKQYPDGMKEEIEENLAKLEKAMGKKLGDATDPLLVSVRSGAKISMPGMMDTVLNLGLNDKNVEAFASNTGNPIFAYDCYRRFIQMYGDVIDEIEHSKFEEVLDSVKEKHGAEFDQDLSAEALKEVISGYKALYNKEKGKEFPQDAKDQLYGAINAVFSSWDNPRAKTYRRLNKIPDELGTAVNVQTMVYGNKGEDSGTGVSFTRNPSNGNKEHYGEFLINAQGEDVVAGIRTPKKIDDLKPLMPKVYEELLEVYEKLEQHFKDMQDFEFTIEDRKLYLLQTRTGKRTGMAAVKIAVDMVNEGMITKETALERVEPEALNQLLHPMIDPNEKIDVVAKGLPASPGAATGQIIFDSAEAAKLAEAGEAVLLVRPETTPEDIEGMHAAKGILTSRGGMTSHAAVVARGMGRACVAGCEDLKIDLKTETAVTKSGKQLKKMDWLTINGTTGEVIDGKVKTIDPELSGEFETLLAWANENKRLGVWTNADTPEDAKNARKFGAEGIGLCRTEHMFFDEKRIPIVREMILSESDEARKDAVERLFPFQKDDFYGIFEAMDGLPVTVRLLDPPLHEFLPDQKELMVEIARMEERNETGASLEEKRELLKKVVALAEFNPMLGHRGCRLGVTFPVIYNMQVRAIIEAACELKKAGKDPKPEIMIPLVGHVNELKILHDMTRETVDGIIKKHGVDLHYMVGTMIEIPRAALTAYEIAEYAEFFSFGTNDLTQMTFGYSRDDAEGKFLTYYVDNKVLPRNPFQTIDQEGVGQLMKFAVESGKRRRKDLVLGICGEHGGEPESIEFCNEIGLNYVSCSPFRVPIARLAAAQATLKNKKKADLNSKTKEA
ncbi:MAG: pyruvate, phosphate dikinase [Candidatus Muiribacterium halophilum]|uniref:Pyruvate, phosphate dikinase n=1 Tax=Muiribacterium halophilum TaxID=2053465 RepID=A0A2N5ZAQ6_MUIH1|nr:MAG: pyruvate, phosphate dikinase [Candidatus Muirbacterium halophilum]